MEIKIVELEKDRARIFFVGEGHTFMNALVDELLQDPLVDVAQYLKEFHFTDPELVVSTLEGRTPLDAITDACTNLAASCDELLSEIRSFPQ
ncbi:MAG: DNA-directed RNA polymerase subunit L [Methanomicrobiales archaeon]|nr:DNA-directed RNA polymerase subunit L [Methanomicrobiales archaeon]